MAPPVTKSYVRNYDSEYPVQEDLVVYRLFDDARKEGFIGEVVNLETGERMSTHQILDKADEYAKGLLALGLVPGEDVFVILGSIGMEAVCLFTAAISVGLGFSHPYPYQPMTVSIPVTLNVLKTKIVVVGEGAKGDTFSALMSFFDESDTTPSCSELPFLKHIVYDNSYNDRSPTHKFLNTLDKLIDMGKSITDQQLQEAKQSVKPDHILLHYFTSGSTGKPKCVQHTHKGLGNELLQLRVHNAEPTLAINVNMDEMYGYVVVGFTLAGKISKTVHMPDYVASVPMEEAARMSVQAMIDEGVQNLGITGSASQLLRSWVEANKIDIPEQKFSLYCSQIFSRQFKEDLMRTFKGKQFTAYGTTEVFFLAFTTLGDAIDDHEARMEARLYPKPNSEVRVVDENDEVVGIGMEGECQIKAYSVFSGYKSQEKETRAMFTKDGFLRTGDVVVMNPDGTIFVKGRAADSIRFKVFGDVVYPGPIEEVISKHPGFRDVSVVAGTCNDAYGDELTYCIRLDEGASTPTEEALMTYCLENGLNESELPCRIVYFDRFPTTENSRKVSKALLRDQVRKMIVENPDTGLCQGFKDFMDDLQSKKP